MQIVDVGATITGYLQVYAGKNVGYETGPQLQAAGSATNLPITLISKGTDGILFSTNGSQG